MLYSQKRYHPCASAPLSIAFLRRWFGYCLTGDTREHALLFVYGPGGNGKGVTLNTVSGKRAIGLGDRCGAGTLPSTSVECSGAFVVRARRKFSCSRSAFRKRRVLALLLAA